MTAAEILKKFKLNRTHCRVLVLEQLMHSEKALSQQELDHSLRPLCNRSTLYRILNTLEQKGLLLRIAIEDNNKYYFDESILSQPEKQLNFVFFHCIRCNDVIPMQQVKREGIRLPEGFTMKEQHFVIRGICKQCNRENYIQ
jgi:Fur family ferric uptake transcriptional regulator